MRHALPGILREMLALLAACLAAGGAAAWLFAEPRLFLGAATGLFAAAVCMWTLAFRTWKSAHLTVAAAKAQMLWGLIVRLFVAGAAFFFAAQGGRMTLVSAACGFLAFYALALALLVRRGLKANRETGFGGERPSEEGG